MRLIAEKETSIRLKAFQHARGHQAEHIRMRRVIKPQNGWARLTGSRKNNVSKEGSAVDEGPYSIILSCLAWGARSRLDRDCAKYCRQCEADGSRTFKATTDCSDGSLNGIV